MGGVVRGLLRPLVPPLFLDLWRRARRKRVSSRDVAGLGGHAADFVLPVQTLEETFPGISVVQATVSAVELDRMDEWELPLAELLTIAVICGYLRPAKVFEFGTYRGSTTLAMALNGPDRTEILTLDLEPALRATHRHGMGVGIPDFPVGLAFRARPESRRIHQLFGDSRTFDFSPLASSVDLVFIDGDHTFEFASHDTQMALRILRPGGTIVWDDYRWGERHPECAGVTRCVNELSTSRRCAVLKGTRFAIFRDDAKVRS